MALPAPDVGSPAVVRAQNASGTFVFVGDEAEIVSINEYSVVSGAPLPLFLLSLPEPSQAPFRHCAHATRAPFPWLGSASGAANVNSSHRHTCTSHGPSRRRPCQCHLVACGSVAAGVVREHGARHPHVDKRTCKCGPQQGGVRLAKATVPSSAWPFSLGCLTPRQVHAVAMVHLYSC